MRPEYLHQISQLKMVKNCQKITKNGQRLPKWPKMDQKWSEMVRKIVQMRQVIPIPNCLTENCEKVRKKIGQTYPK
jgi:bacillopeptidase F (M6 metalloprotease family)